MKRIIRHSSLLFILLLFFFGCTKEENDRNISPTCEITTPVNGEEYKKGSVVTISAEAQDEDGEIAEIRFYIDGVGMSSSTSFPYKYNWESGESALGNHTIKIVASDDSNLEASDEIIITLISKTLPVVSTINATQTNLTEAACGGNVTDEGDSPVIMRGVCWSMENTPTTNDRKTENGRGLGTFSSVLTALQANAVYKIRAYATSEVGTAYGNLITLELKENFGTPTVETGINSEVTSSNAQCYGKVINQGNSSIIERGICYNKEGDPTTNDLKVTVSTNGEGEFVCELQELSSETKYYYRAFATNEQGTAYGEVKTFQTAQAPPAQWEFIADLEYEIDGDLWNQVSSDSILFLLNNSLYVFDLKQLQQSKICDLPYSFRELTDNVWVSPTMINYNSGIVHIGLGATLTGYIYTSDGIWTYNTNSGISEQVWSPDYAHYVDQFCFKIGRIFFFGGGYWDQNGTLTTAKNDFYCFNYMTNEVLTRTSLPSQIESVTRNNCMTISSERDVGYIFFNSTSGLGEGQLENENELYSYSESDRIWKYIGEIDERIQYGRYLGGLLNFKSIKLTHFAFNDEIYVIENNTTYRFNLEENVVTPLIACPVDDDDITLMFQCDNMLYFIKNKELWGLKLN
ncbi:Ig-like domain-containing protein [Maribellus maritimus]|uniref:Ig-like domain-containing protein n=1 Tax=Maribellus maritimus TaxID=2870838 RepID=UPI001EEA1411|nr:Ig-like domain-containing protein [Maribellus maritimus]MCG6187693.1 hypothetical protein [Maribellus maritimus]